MRGAAQHNAMGPRHGARGGRTHPLGGAVGRGVKNSPMHSLSRWAVDPRHGLWRNVSYETRGADCADRAFADGCGGVSAADVVVMRAPRGQINAPLTFLVVIGLCLWSSTSGTSWRHLPDWTAWLLLAAIAGDIWFNVTEKRRR